MSIQVQIQTLVVPISVIEHYSGKRFVDWLDDSYLSHVSRKRQQTIFMMMAAGAVCFDDYLFVERSMGSNGFESFFPIDEWKKKGFQLTNTDSSEWIDGCVVTNPIGPSKSCDWIVYHPEKQLICHKDDTRGTGDSPEWDRVRAYLQRHDQSLAHPQKELNQSQAQSRESDQARARSELRSNFLITALLTLLVILGITLGVAAGIWLILAIW